MRGLSINKDLANGYSIVASGSKVGEITVSSNGAMFALRMYHVYWNAGVPNAGRGGSSATVCKSLKEEVKRLKAMTKAAAKQLADPKKAADDVKKALGLPPYDGAFNPCRSDGIFHNYFEKTHGMTVEEAAKLLGLDKVYAAYQADMEKVRRKHS